MIDSISIENLGVIERTELHFGPGLTVLTGETGAGKTMVLTSLHLLLGRRADPGIVRKGTSASLVDGIFTVSEDIASRAAQAGAELEDDELIVSRSVPAQGRSRARIGGRPVPATILAEIGEQLVTIHGQSDQLALTSTAAQLRVLDEYGSEEHAKILSDYEAAWDKAVSAKRALDSALTSQDDRENEIAALQAAISAIEDLNIEAGEEDELRAQIERLTNIEDLRADIARAHGILVSADGEGVTDCLRAATDYLRHGARFDQQLEAFEQRAESLRLEIEALVDDLGVYLRGLEADPQRLAQLHDRRAAIKDLLRGRAADTMELLEWYEQAKRRLDELTSATATPEECERELKKAQAAVLCAGKKLSESRATLASTLSDAITAELRGLAMPHAIFHIRLNERKPASTGLETVEFLLQPHPDMTPAPLGSGASGGELSRVMLAIEVTLGSRSGTPTYIFDEVDAGIGGRTATEVGRRLGQLAQHKQVIVVTHLPQVAAWATTHLVVEKNGATTSVRAVQGLERVDEIARMMGAEEGSDVARRHAKELLSGVNVPQSLL